MYNGIKGEFYIDDLGEVHIQMHTPDTARFEDLELVFDKLVLLIQKMKLNKNQCPYYNV